MNLLFEAGKEFARYRLLGNNCSAQMVRKAIPLPHWPAGVHRQSLRNWRMGVIIDSQKRLPGIQSSHGR